ncbi:hypothetical protein J1N35_001268 [Gossypium stocksii]|uniref:Uncharacterized protein n=1 Tax=Gossypium stocksii TaxID=47602 RepID=A0A9D3WJF2_9ROSI|nr:hypothetical protein J1N35_001268 [Gossypium stocksii]
MEGKRNDGWESLLHNVKEFYEWYGIVIPDKDTPYLDVLKSLRQQGRQKKTMIMAHHYRVEIFTVAIDQQLQEFEQHI